MQRRPLAREWDSTTQKENIFSLEHIQLGKCLCAIFARTFSRLFLPPHLGRSEQEEKGGKLLSSVGGGARIRRVGGRGVPRYPPFPTGGGRTGGDLVPGKRERERGGGTEKARGTIEREGEGEKAFLGRSPAAAVATSEEGEGGEAPSFFPSWAWLTEIERGAQSSRPSSESPSPLCSAKSLLSRVFFSVRQSLFSLSPFPRWRWATEGEREGGREGERGTIPSRVCHGGRGTSSSYSSLFLAPFFLRCASSAPLSQKMQLQPLHRFPFRSAVGRTIMHCGVQYTLAGPSPHLACTIVQSACSCVTSLAESKLGKGRKKGQQKNWVPPLGAALSKHTDRRGLFPLVMPPSPCPPSSCHANPAEATHRWTNERMESISDPLFAPPTLAGKLGQGSLSPSPLNGPFLKVANFFILPKDYSAKEGFLRRFRQGNLVLRGSRGERVLGLNGDRGGIRRAINPLLLHIRPLSFPLCQSVLSLSLFSAPGRKPTAEAVFLSCWSCEQREREGPFPPSLFPSQFLPPTMQPSFALSPPPPPSPQTTQGMQYLSDRRPREGERGEERGKNSDFVAVK